MKGFTIYCYTEKGEKCLRKDLNTNRNVFDINTENTPANLVKKPFLTISFLFSSKPQGRLIRRMMNMVPEAEALKHVAGKLEELGARKGEDFEIRVIP